MEIKIFDVAHGFCAYVVADNGNTMLVDCGHNNQTDFYPADYLLARNCTGIERFFVTNYDEDHLSGLPRLRAMAPRIPIRILHRNRSVTAQELRALKRQGGPLGPGISSLLDMVETYTADVVNPPEYPAVEFEAFHNDYPALTDTNNLSLVLFLHYPGLSIVFPGDLEQEGWGALLQNSRFRDHLARVNVFVASHHGRESGYLPEVFQYCRPNVIIISDESMRFDTQFVAYQQHATGIRWNESTIRKVLSTRNDGMLTISGRGGSFFIQAER